MATVRDFIFLGSKITADGDCSHKIKRPLLLGRKAVTNLDITLKSRDITLPTKVRLVKAMVFQVVIWMCELDYKESWAPKNWCFWTVVLEKTLESLLDCKEIQPVPPKENRSRIFTGKSFQCQSWNSNTLATWCKEPTHWKSPWCWERLRAGEEGDDREWDGWMVHWLNGHEFEQAPEDGEGHGKLTCCSPWGLKESDMTEQLNNNKPIESTIS